MPPPRSQHDRAGARCEQREGAAADKLAAPAFIIGRARADVDGGLVPERRVARHPRQLQVVTAGLELYGRVAPANHRVAGVDLADDAGGVL